MPMSWTQFKNLVVHSDRITLLFAGTMVIIAFVALGTGIWHWLELSSGRDVSVFITSVSAFGTLILAAATFFSIRHGQRSLSELEKEREKPIVKDEIVKVIQPAIDALSANVERAESEVGVDWVYSQPFTYNPHGATDTVSSVFADPTPVAMRQLQDARPDLWRD